MAVRVKLMRPVRVNGAFYDKGSVGEFEELDWFLSGLIKSGEASLIAEAKPVAPVKPAEPEPVPEAVPAEKEAAAAPEKPVKKNVRKRNGG